MSTSKMSEIKSSTYINGFNLQGSVPTFPPQRFDQPLKWRSEELASEVSPLYGKIFEEGAMEEKAKDNKEELPRDKAEAALAVALDTSRRVDAVLAEVRSSLNEFRNELREGFQALRIELKSDIQSLRSEVKQDIQSLRSEVKQDIQSLRSEVREDINSLRSDFAGRINQLQGHINIWLMVLTAVIALFALFMGLR